MTLRQEYAGPRPRTIARHLDQPGRAAAPAHTGPAGISPPHQPGPGARLPQQPSQPRAGCAHRGAQAQNSARSRGPATGWTPAAWPPKSGHSIYIRLPGPTAGSCRASRHPAPPVPITGGLPRGLRRWSRI